ncbi:MAG: hypothetical protein PHW04_18390 [Candidatus Wallbacteria bacterium]|nr:hypothetical protein [Candidatus Wallbacteria bacterium]
MKTVLIAVLLLAGMVVSNGAEPAAGFRGDFQIGCNVAWFEGAYNHDFGANPDHPYWGTTFDAAKYKETLEGLSKHGAKLLRVWAYEEEEGWKFGSDGKLEGLDNQFLDNWKKFLAESVPEGVKLHVSLLDSNAYSPKSGKSERAVKLFVEGKDTYIEKVLKPFVQMLAGSSKVVSIDLINEPEAMVKGGDANYTDSGLSWDEVRAFIKDSAAACKEAAPGLQVACSSGWHGLGNIKSGKFDSLGLDFLEAHMYDDNPDIPPAGSVNALPILLGEYGQATESSDDKLQLDVTRKFLAGTKSLGYLGALMWHHGDLKNPDHLSLRKSDGSWRPAADVMLEAAKDW